MSAESLQTLAGLLQALGWTLIDFVWQGAAIGAIYGATRALLHKASAQVRLQAGHLALLALMLAPVLTFAGHWSPHGAGPGAGGMGVVETFLVTDIAGAAAAQAVQPGLLALVAAWAVGVCLLGARAVMQWRRLQRIRREASVASGAWRARMRVLASRLGVRTPVALLESAEMDVPVLIGWLKPAILLPVGILLRLPAEQVELLIAHELAHVRRLDYLANLLQLALETLLFYHPVVHWVSRRVREDREQCCDDMVTASGGDRYTYARALLALEEARTGPGFAPALAATGGVLLERIERIVLEPPSQRAAPTALVWLAVFAALALSTWMVSLGDRQRDALVERLMLLPSPLMLAIVPPRLSIEPAQPAVSLPTLQLRRESLPVEAPQESAAPLPVVDPPMTAQTPEAPAASAIAPAAAVPLESTPGFAAQPPPAAAEIAPTAPPTEAAPATRPQPEPSSMVAKPLRAPPPAYPSEARRRGAQGSVRVSYGVAANGRVENLVVESVDIDGFRHVESLFEDSVRRALAGWRYAAEASGGGRIEKVFEFRLAQTVVAGDGSGCARVTGSRICRPVAAAPR